MPNKKGAGVFRCPQCRQASHFTLLRARLTPQTWRQVSAGRWKPVDRPARKYEATAVMALICESCGCPASVPRVLLAQFDRA